MYVRTSAQLVSGGHHHGGGEAKTIINKILTQSHNLRTKTTLHSRQKLRKTKKDGERVMFMA